MPAVTLVSMPFGPLRSPSLGLGLLKEGLRRKGISSRVRNFTLDYAALIGAELYISLSSEYPFAVDLIGEWIFSGALGTGDPETYVRQVIEGGHPDHHQRIAGRLGGAAAARNAAVELRKGTGAFIDACVDRILEDAPRVVGFSSVFEQTAASLAAARRIKERSPGTLIVFGGANAEGAMGEALFDLFPFLDAVFSGECDHRFPEAMAAFLSTGQISMGDGAWVRPWLSGGVAPASFEEAMDALPVPDFGDYFTELGELDLELPGGSAILFETSRGCWWGEKHHCTFCGLNGGTMAFRSKSPDRALSEFKHLRARHPDSQVVVADNILDMGYFKTFLPALAEERHGAELFYEVKANLTKDQLRILKAAGVATIQPGIESLSDGVLKLMDKGVRGIQSIQLLKWCAELGMDAAWNLLYGFPGEDGTEYPRMAELLPLLHHLAPPMACVQVRLDRFSPNFEQADAKGFREVRAYPSYEWVFSLSQADAARMAYYFTYRHADGREPAEYALPLVDAVDHWRDSRRGETLFMFDKGTHLLIFDGRAVAPSPLVSLEGDQAWALRACDGVASIERLAQMASRDGITEDALRSALDALLKMRLLIRDGGLHLALPIPVTQGA